MEPRDITYTARFPMADRASSFACRVSDEPDGWGVKHIVHKGRMVTWVANPVERAIARCKTSGFSLDDNAIYPGGPEFSYFHDLLETVGYYGSDQRRRASLQDSVGRGPVPAPVSY